MAWVTRNLKSLRESAGLSITQLARLSNTSDLIVSRLEDNQRPDTISRPQFGVSQVVAQRIADALGTDLTTLGAVDLH